MFKKPEQQEQEITQAIQWAKTRYPDLKPTLRLKIARIILMIIAALGLLYLALLQGVMVFYGAINPALGAGYALALVTGAVLNIRWATALLRDLGRLEQVCAAAYEVAKSKGLHGRYW